MDDKRKKYLRIFKAEADEHLMVLNNGLLELEKGKASQETIHDIFRAAHTLKGSSRMLGLEEIGAIAHKMEDLLKAVEDEQIKPTSNVIDRLLEGADNISRLLEPEETREPVDHEAVIKRLVQVMEQGGGEEPPAGQEKEKKAKSPADKKKKKAAKGKEPGPEPEGGDEVLEFKEPEKPPPPSKTAPEEIKPHEMPAPDRKAEIRQKVDTLRVDTGRLDGLVDLAGELLINKIKLEGRTFSAKELLEDLSEVLANFDEISMNGNRAKLKERLHNLRNYFHEFVQELTEDIIELDVNVQEIQSGTLQLRMTPASTLFDEFPRLVRDLARDLKKQIRLDIRGEETELDKRLLEQLRGPMIHLIRNACDHGIETPDVRLDRGKPATGNIHLQAYHHGGTVVIEVTDDGAGMDAARIREVAVQKGVIDERMAAELSDEEAHYLALMPGFSTSSLITDLSGRGVGLDVVKTNVENLRGDMNIRSRSGEGTKIELRLPLTVSIIEALLVSQSGDVFAIPLTAVEEVMRVRVADLVMDRGREAVAQRGQLLSLIRLGDLLGLPALPGTLHELKSSEDMLQIVVLKFRNQHLAMEVDKTVREQEILVKALGSHLARVPLVSGATILRKGEPALILNVFDIFEEAERMEGKHIKDIVSVWEKEQRLPRILVVDDSITTRTIEKNILERAGYEVVTSVNGNEALEEMDRAEPMFDLFVIDVDMPGINGFELTEKLRKDPRSKAVPVIIVTSRASDEDKRKGISVGAQAYIVKGSFDQNVLLDTVKSLIGD